MPLLTLPHIEERLKDHEPLVLDTRQVNRQAAVAAILREYRGETQALFIKRAERPGDIWSGHMAFPGGHWETEDLDLAQTAIRETHEEIGLDLTRHGRLLGHLDYMNINPIGTTIEMIIVPFVFVVEGELPPFKPNHEVADVLWGSIHRMYHGKAHISRDFHVRGQTQNFSGYDVEDQIVWGLTYRMLHQFFSVLDPDWEIPAS